MLSRGRGVDRLFPLREASQVQDGLHFRNYRLRLAAPVSHHRVARGVWSVCKHPKTSHYLPHLSSLRRKCPAIDVTISQQGIVTAG